MSVHNGKSKFGIIVDSCLKMLSGDRIVDWATKTCRIKIGVHMCRGSAILGPELCLCYSLEAVSIIGWNYRLSGWWTRFLRRFTAAKLSYF